MAWSGLGQICVFQANGPGPVYRLGVFHPPSVLTDLFGGQYDIGVSPQNTAP